MFRTGSFLVDTVYKDLQTVSRYLAAELYPQYSLWDNISIGTYLLRAYCLEKDAIKNTTLMALRLNFTKISLSEKVYLRLLPQVYYLRMDDMDGFYFTSTASLVKAGFPFYLSSIISTPFRTSIPQKNNFVWNFSLTWTFNKALVEKQGIL
jgi:hypothetical protein